MAEDIFSESLLERPGVHLRKEISALNLSVTKAAAALGVTRSKLSRIVAGQSAISPEMALRLEAVIGGSAISWLRLQAAYDLECLRLRADEITQDLSPLWLLRKGTRRLSEDDNDPDH